MENRLFKVSLPNLSLFLAIIYFIVLQVYSNYPMNYESISVYYEKPTNPIESVPSILQNPTLPTGCEAVCATMLLQWAGINISAEEVAILLPRGDIPTTKNGKLVGSNPNDAFIGNPFTDKGFGVFHKPIAEVINTYLNAEDLTGAPSDRLFEVIDSGRPLIVWTTMYLKEPKLNSVWYDENGKTVEWKTPEHAMLMVGYTADKIIVNDPLVGGYVEYDKETLLNRWEAMGSQAVTIALE